MSSSLSRMGCGVSHRFPGAAAHTALQSVVLIFMLYLISRQTHFLNSYQRNKNGWKWTKWSKVPQVFTLNWSCKSRAWCDKKGAKRTWKNITISSRAVPYLNHTWNLALLWPGHFSHLKYTVEGKAREQLRHLSGREEAADAAACCTLPVDARKNHWICFPRCNARS